MPDGSGAFRPHLLPGVGVLSLSGSIDRPQRGVLALVVLRYVRIGPDEEFACSGSEASEREPHLFVGFFVL